MGIVRGAIGAIVIAAILASSALAEEGVGFGAPDAQPEPGITFVLRGEELARSGDPFSAIAEFRRAIAVGYRQTEVYRSLSTVLYLAGFADQAIEALEEGIRLHPEEISPRLELGVLHFAVGHEAKAEKLFLEVVAANPTLANPYHYLGVIASRHKKDDEAWLFARRAQLLGHKDTSLLELLRARSPEPAIDQRQPVGDAFCFRQILVPSFEVAEEARQRLVQGEMFEVLAGMVSTGPSAANGGFVGCLPADELDGPLAAALWSQKPYGEPVIVETGRGAHVVQRVLSFDPMGWRVQLAELKRRPGKNGAGPAASVVAATAKTPASPAKVAAPAPVVTGVAVASVPPSLEADETRGRHAVHAGTYNGPVLAEAMVARLAESGFPATFHAVTGKDGAVSYRVVGGYYDDMVEANRASLRLTEMGVNNFIVTAQKMVEKPETNGASSSAAEPEETKGVDSAVVPAAVPKPAEATVSGEVGKSAAVPTPVVERLPAAASPAAEREGRQAVTGTANLEVPAVPPATPAAVAPVVVEEVLTERPAVPAPPALDKPAVARDVDGGQAAKVEVEVPVVPPATPAAVAPVVVEEVLTEQPAVPAQPALDKPAVAYEVDGGQAATVDVEVPVVPPATPAAVAPVVVEEVLTERPAAPAPPALDKPAVAYEVDGGQAATAGAAQAVEKKVEGAGAVAVGTAATGSLVVDNKGNQPRGKYTLHAGTVEHRQEATAKVARLRQSGFPAFAYAIAGKSGALVYRVVAGRYDVMVEAKAASRRLAELGVGSFIANTR